MSIATRPRGRGSGLRPNTLSRHHRPSGGRSGAAPVEPPMAQSQPVPPDGIAGGRFALVVTLILGAGLVAALSINTSLAAGTLELTDLEYDLARAEEQRQALELEVEALSSPQQLQAGAIALGMVPATSPVFLDPASGALLGDLAPAEAPEAPMAQTPQVGLPPGAEDDPAAIEPTESEAGVAADPGTAGQQNGEGDSAVTEDAPADDVEPGAPGDGAEPAPPPGSDGATVVQRGEGDG